MSTPLTFPQFERLLLSGDADSLSKAGYPDAACIASGNFDIFSDAYRSAEIASDCLQLAGTQVTLRSQTLTRALADASGGSQPALISCYIAGISLLQSFIRHNWAGPSQKLDNTDQNQIASFFLMLDGEDVAFPSRRLHYLRAALHILVDHVQEFIRNGSQLIAWWSTRALLAHHAVLSSPTPTIQYNLFTMYARFMGSQVAETRYLFANKAPTMPGADYQEEEDDDDLLPAPVSDANEHMTDEDSHFVCALDENDSVDRQLLVLANLELCIAQRLFYDTDGAMRTLNRADRLAGISFRISGEMGVRTKFQVKPTAQLVARAFETPMSQTLVPAKSRTLSFLLPLHQDTESQNETMSTVPVLPLPKNIPLADSDLLGYIKLTDPPTEPCSDTESNDGMEQDTTPLGPEKKHLTAVEQALALCHASVVRARNASHLLTKEEMSPYIDMVLRNASSPHGASSVVHMHALIMRVSFERERGRFLERCMAQMEEISQFIDRTVEEENLVGAERALFTFAASLPPRWELKKQLAISFGKLGLVKSAMEIFEELEFWDELVDCHRLMGNLGVAEAMIRTELEKLDVAVLEDGTKLLEEPLIGLNGLGANRAVQARAARRPRLLCVLGDVTRDRKHFETAWEESGGKYARAKRALARLCVQKEEWAEAVIHFREALKLNSLFPEAWFTYGCSAMEIDDWGLAANAFTRVVQQMPDNGEAWNNLARVLHEMGKEKEALKALGEAARIKRDSWRIWNNVLVLAVELRSSSELVRAMERMLELRGKDGVEEEGISVAVEEVIRMSTSEDMEDKAMVGDVSKRLLRVLGRCSVLVSTNATVWEAYAKLYEIMGDEGVQKAFDCRLKQVRALVAHGNWICDRLIFRKMVVAMQSLVEDGIKTGMETNKRTAKLQVESIMEQTELVFRRDDGWKQLEEVIKLLV